MRRSLAFNQSLSACRSSFMRALSSIRSDLRSSRSSALFLSSVICLSFASSRTISNCSVSTVTELVNTVKPIISDCVVFVCRELDDLAVPLEATVAVSWTPCPHAIFLAGLLLLIRFRWRSGNLLISMENDMPEGKESLIDERFVVGISRSWVRVIAETLMCPCTR